MSLKLKAFLQMTGLVALAVAIAKVVQFINTNVSSETLFTALQISLIGLLLYSCYSLLLTRLEINEQYKKLDK